MFDSLWFEHHFRYDTKEFFLDREQALANMDREGIVPSEYSAIKSVRKQYRLRARFWFSGRIQLWAPVGKDREFRQRAFDHLKKRGKIPDKTPTGNETYLDCGDDSNAGKE